MSLNEVKIPDTVTIKIPEKAYFKKYTHKIEFEASREKNEYLNRKPESGYGYHSWSYKRPDFWKVKQEVTNKLRTLLAEEEEKLEIKFDYRIRQEGYTVSIFFADPRILALVFNDKLKSKVITLYKPLNETHASRMEIEKRLRVRKTLFLNSYRYKLYLSPYQMRKINAGDISQWLQETFPEEFRAKPNPGLRIAFLNSSKKNNKNPQYSWQYNTTLAIYFNDETDLMIAKLRLHDCISHVEEAVLLEELE